MKKFYVHGMDNTKKSAKHFAEVIIAANKDEAIKIFINKYGTRVYLTEIYDLNNPLPTQVD